MFVGHYAAALGAKAVEPRAPLWAYVGACQLMDIGWSALVMGGVEKMRIDPSLPGSSLDLYFMPYTHSLPGALALSVLAAVLGLAILRLPWRAAAMVGAVVFSHWMLDLLVHRPDLLLWIGGPKVGLGLWNYPLPEMVLEMGLVAIAGAAWVAKRKSDGLKAAAAVGFIAFLVVLQMIGSWTSGGSEGDTAAMAGMALAAYLVAVALAWLVDRVSASPGRPKAA